MPTRRAPEALRRLLMLFRYGYPHAGLWREFIDGQGADALRWVLDDLARTPPPEEAPELYRDRGTERPFEVRARGGECAV